MKKKSSRSEKNTRTSEFLVPASDDEFSALMKRSGVVKLNGETGEKPSPEKIETPDERVRFEKASGESGLFASAKRAKYTRKPENRTKTPRKTKKLKPGFIPDLELDLHGNTQKEAVSKTEKTIDYCLQKQLDHLLIITGKGWNSGQGEGVLRQSVWNWLNINKKGLQYRFKWAPGFLGGKGAIIVFFN